MQIRFQGFENDTRQVNYQEMGLYSPPGTDNKRYVPRVGIRR